MGLSDEQIASAVRVSWGDGVTAIPAQALVEFVNRLK
jgi:hypothetical protein